MKRMLIVAAAFTSLAATAGPGMQPGNYEYTIKMEMPGMPFAMPPQTFQRCVTQADVDQGKQYKSDERKECETKNMKRSANGASFDMVCKDGSTGKASYTFSGDGMTGKTVMTMKEGQSMTMNMSSKRAGDCK